MAISRAYFWTQLNYNDMKTKTLLSFCFCAFYLTATCDPTNPPTNAQTIHLVGDLDYNAESYDVEAYVDGHYVYVSFHRNFGNVSITLYDPDGLTLYSDVVNTGVQQLVVIPVSAFMEGIYTIVLESILGSAEGEFEQQS